MTTLPSIDVDEAVAVGDTYTIHLVGKSDKDIASFWAALHHVLPDWENLDGNTCPHETVTAHTDFDITFSLRAIKLCGLSEDPYITFVAQKGDQAVDINNPVTLRSPRLQSKSRLIEEKSAKISNSP